MKGSFLLFLLLCSPLIVNSFTREKRSIDLTSEKSKKEYHSHPRFSFDPVSISLSNYNSDLVNVFNKILKERLNIELEEILIKYQQQLLESSTYSTWLANADTKSKSYFAIVNEDVISLNDKGIDFLVEREPCLKHYSEYQLSADDDFNSADPIKRRKRKYEVILQNIIVGSKEIECFLLRTVAKFNLVPLQTLSSQFLKVTRTNTSSESLKMENEIDNILSSLKDWLSATEYLFNSEQYQYADAFGMQIIKFFKILISDNDLSSMNKRTSIKLIYLLRNTFVVLTETSKEIGELDRSIHFGLQLVSAFNDFFSFDQTEKENLAAEDALYRLRILLTVPPVPPSSVDALKHRKEMIEDLKIFHTDLLSQNQKIHIPIQKLMSLVSATPFHIAHQSLNDLEFQFQLGKIYKALSPDFDYISPHLLNNNSFNNAIDTESKIDFKKDSTFSVAFISSHFFDHSVGKMLVELIHYLNSQYSENMHRRNIKLKITVFFIDYSQNVASGYRQDAVTNFLSSTLGNNFIRINPSANFKKMRSTIASANLDLLIFADLGMDFTTYALAHARLANFQIAWWGHPVTSGLDTIDYYFSLDQEILDGHLHYTEQLVRMDFMNTAPIASMNRTTREQNELNDDIKWNKIGIPKGAKICLVLGRLFKIHPQFGRAISSILLASSSGDHSVSSDEGNNIQQLYVVVITERISAWNEKIYNYVWEGFKEEVEINSNSNSNNNSNARNPVNLNEIIKRFKFVNYDFYLHLLQLATVVLDTFPYGGCLTTHDAFAYGIPMVTLPLDQVSGRYTLGLYHQMGSTALVATNASHYVDLTLNLVSNNTFWDEQASLISQGYANKMHKNNLAAKEWSNFIITVVSNTK